MKTTDGLSKSNSKILLLGLLVAGVLVGIRFAWTLSKDNTDLFDSSGNSQVSSGDLTVPRLLDFTEEQGIKNFSLTAQPGEYEFVDGVKSKTSGYSGDILGPTIRVTEGDEVNIAVSNELDEQTTSHWHGAIVPGDADGGVHNIIQPNETWNARFTVIQEAATLWYHPHQHEETARQVYEGMGGFLLIDDENSKNLNLPSEYGVDDIPLIIQSKNLDRNGKLIDYSISQHERINGMEGNTVLLNAQIKPTFTATTNLVRLRILNGSNSDIYKVALSDGAPFYVIASDGGLYNEPIETSYVEIPTAKRFEILIDATQIKDESVSLMVNGSPELTIDAGSDLALKYEVPSITNNIEPITYDGTIDKEFDMEFLMGGGGMGMGMMGGTYGINGKLFDMERIDFEVTAGTTEYWKITNIGRPGPGLFHPFHVHATQFEIVEFNGEEPNQLQEGRHDTIYLAENDTAVIAVPFDASIDGLFLYHCHILEHEDGGMMGQFKINNDRIIR